MSVVVSDVSRLIFSDIMGGAASPSQSVTLTNNGVDPVNLTGVSITGTNATRFGATFSAVTIAAGETASIPITFNPTAPGVQGATLTVTTNEATANTIPVTLRGLGTKGEQGNLEPSLQWILDTFQIPIKVGDADPTTTSVTFPLATPNDEIVAQTLKKAGEGPVTIELLAAYTQAVDPGGIFGYYDPTTLGGTLTPGAMTQLLTFGIEDTQTLNPTAIGATSFDPGDAAFGIYTQWPAFPGRTAYTQDFLNTWEPDAARRREFSFYPLKNADGSIVPNAYVVGNEEAANHDLQDLVFIIRNVQPFVLPPDAPQNVAVGSTTSSSVKINWVDTATNETGYEIEKSEDSGANWTAVAMSAANSTSYTATGLTGGSSYMFRVRAVNTGGTSEYGTTDLVTLPTGPAFGPVPAPWVGIDIGSVGGAGSQGLDSLSGTLLVSGAGMGPSGSTADAMHYLYRNVTGTSTTIVAHVSSFGTGSTGAKAGVTIRSSTSGGARHATLSIGADGLVYFSRRKSSNSTTTTTTSAANGAEWVRITRSGTGITVAVSVNGTTWTNVGTTTITYDATLTVGLVSFSGNGTPIDATFTDVSINGAATNPPTAPPTPPTPPAAPASVTASVASPTSVNLSWTDVSNETSYLVEVSSDEGNTWTLQAITDANTTNIVPAGLLPETSYEFRVRAINSAGESDFVYSDVVTTPPMPVVTFGPVPTPWVSNNVGTVATATGTDQLDPTTGAFNLFGTGAGFSGSTADAAHYLNRSLSGTTTSIAAQVLSQSESAGAAGVTLRSSTSGGARHVTVLIRDNGQALFVRRKSSNSSTTTTSMTVPGAKWARITRSGNDFTAAVSVDGVTWTTLGTTNFAMDGAYTAGLVVYSGGAATNSVMFSDVAINGAPTNPPTAPPLPPTPPAAPTNVTAAAVTNSTATVSWNDIATNESGYVIEYSNDSGTTWVPLFSVAANATSTPVTGLNGATTYIFRVRATNSAGDSDFAVSNAITTPSEPPPATTVTLGATADAMVTESSPTVNAGVATSFSTRTASGLTRWTYLKFDLSTFTGDSIDSAVLRLNGKLTANGTISVGVYAVSSSTWTESGVTWNNKPATGTTALATKMVTGTTAAWYEWDLTSYLQAEKAAGHTVVSIAIKSVTTSSTLASFNSREATTLKPELVVTG